MISQNLHKRISTHHLTVLIMSAILHLEQRKRKRFKEFQIFQFKETGKQTYVFNRKGEMTYVDA